MYTLKAFIIFGALFLSCKSFELEDESENKTNYSPTPPPDYKFHKDSNSNNASVIIIGAGPSGIAAATKLLRNNFTNVKILEAENRIGGRINSVKFGDQYVDLGAQFCHGQDDNVVYYMVKDLNVLKHFEGDVVELYLSNGNKLDQNLQKKLFNFEHTIDASANNEETEAVCKDSKSIGNCFDLKYDILLKEAADEKEKKVLKDAKTWLNGYLCSYDANFDLHDLARKSAYKKCGGDLYINWNGHGYKTVLEVMMGKFPNTSTPLPMDDKILLNKEVTNIKNWKDGNQINVITTEGEIFTADHIIFTPSAGVLKANHEKLFDPPLPEDKVNAIKGIGFGAILKIIIKFPEPLKNLPNLLGTIWRKEDLEEANQKGFGWLEHLNGVVFAENNPRVLTGWYAAGNVTDIEGLSDEEIMNGQKFFVKKFLKDKFGVPEPEDFIRSSWYSNPHFRGTYSYESVEGHEKCGSNFQETLGKSLLNKDSKPTLLFAGEATHPYYFSTVHGAIETGYKQANKLINYYKKSE